MLKSAGDLEATLSVPQIANSLSKYKADWMQVSDIALTDLSLETRLSISSRKEPFHMRLRISLLAKV